MGDDFFVDEVNKYCFQGDIGQWNPDGTLSVIDRYVDRFKLRW